VDMICHCLHAQFILNFFESVLAHFNNQGLKFYIRYFYLPFNFVVCRSQKILPQFLRLINWKRKKLGKTRRILKMGKNRSELWRKNYST
jgi:hypothetical protein